jgi:hypothetical protein
MEVGFTAHNILVVIGLIVVAFVFCREVGKW